MGATQVATTSVGMTDIDIRAVRREELIKCYSVKGFYAV